MRYMYTMEYYLAIEKTEIMSSAAIWMQLEIIILSQSERERQIPYDITYTWNLKYGMNEPSMKQKQTHRHRVDWWVTRGRGWNGFSRGKLLYTEWINSKVLLYSTENYIQYPTINHNGKEYKKQECIYMYN